ncbi:MAG: YtxH domain-containing protein [Flavobacteriales bacterium]
MSTQKTILGFLGGIAAGAALGILFAPQSGKKTRKSILRRADRAKDDLSDLIEEGHKQWRKARNKAADAATMTKAEVEDFVRYMMKEGKGLRDRVTDDARNTASNLADHGKRSAEDLRKTAAN